MKKIVHGRKYDTDTATKIASMDNDLGRNDFRRIEETLYLKKTGEYFIFGKGGPMTRYSEYDGNVSRGSCDIVPISIEDAKKWAATYMTVDKFEAHFGKVAE